MRKSILIVSIILIILAIATSSLVLIKMNEKQNLIHVDSKQIIQKEVVKTPTQYPKNNYAYASEGPIGGPQNYCS